METLNQGSAYNLLLLTKSAVSSSKPSYKPVGQITLNSNGKIISRDITSTRVRTIDDIHTQFLELFHDNHGILSLPDGLIGNPYVLKSNDVTLLIFWVMKWRGCTGFLAFQKSNKGRRFLFYASDKIMYPAVSFCTTCDIVNIDQIIESFKQAIRENKNQITILQRELGNDQTVYAETVLIENFRILLEKRQILDSDFVPEWFGI
jgi:hypothetical protein